MDISRNLYPYNRFPVPCIAADMFAIPLILDETVETPFILEKIETLADMTARTLDVPLI
jgi:hypothetical protein